jgi:hypothetical protein
VSLVVVDTDVASALLRRRASPEEAGDTAEAGASAEPAR